MEEGRAADAAGFSLVHTCRAAAAPLRPVDEQLMQPTATMILDSAGEGIIALDADGRVTFVNRTAERMLGYPAGELVGHLATDFAGVLTPGRETARTKDGRTFPVEYTATPMVGDDESTGTVVVFRDVSERQEVDRMKDEFTSIASHELRTSLTSIRGALGLLASGAGGPLEPKAEQMVEIAVDSTDRLVRLINDMLDLERMQGGRNVIERSDCEARELIERAVAIIKPMADAASVRLTVSAEPAATLQADPDRMLQALTNLLSNAITCSPAGGTVQVSARRRADDLVFSVQDEGRGIPAEKLQRVFERFEQVDASRDKSGTGLGLAICAGIVEQHGGRIWAESPPGEGTTLSFTVPTDPLSRIAADPAAAPDDRPLVLVCDDDPDVLDVVTEIIERHGYRVQRAASGQQALRMAAAEPPAVILLDLLMPRMDGWETAAALRRQPGTEAVPVVILSVLVKGETDPVAADVVGWLEKPLHERSLVEALDRAVHRGEGARGEG